jgi:hypothetical protein
MTQEWQVVKKYIAARASMVKCMQKQFKQVCHTCKGYAHCQKYGNYVNSWMELQKSVEKQPTRVVNIKEEGCDVYIGRGSKWGNPFSIGKDGTREEVIEKYLEWILEHPKLLRSLSDLEGKRIGCWCKPKDCHGDVLVALIEEEQNELY